MGIIDRLGTLLKSNINDLISRAEDPEKVLTQLITDMRGQLAKAKQEVAGAIADEKKLRAQVEKAKQESDDWQQRAMVAVQQERDDLAKQALMRHNEHLQAAQALHETWMRQKAETETLKASLRTLNDKIEEAKRKKNLLVARQKRAEAQQRIQETISSMGDTSAFDHFERMAAKIEEVERKQLAAAELNEELTGDSLEAEFAQLEHDGTADQQLLELKRQMGLLGSGKEDEPLNLRMVKR
ncbi:MAG: PspA/IM30 family protein [Gemmatimonadota bacterium]|nr:PspA/IM30 family protein [Gemmatimonadota bacterium]